MKKKLLMVLPLLFVVGCATSNSNGNNSSQQTSEVITTMPLIEVEEGYEYNQDFSWDVYCVLTNIMGGAYLPVGEEFNLEFSFKNASIDNYMIESSNQDVLSTRIDDKNKAHIICKAPGDSILIIRDNLRVIHFRYVVHVREKLKLESAEEYLQSVDYFKSQAPQWSGGNYDMNFVGNSTFYFNSYVEGEVVDQLKMTYEFEKITSQEITYKITSIEPLSETIKFIYFDLDITGFEIRVYDNVGLFDLFRPASNKNKE